ncbi:acyl transferase/acyl hydrolase/lysophospholipase [Lasiosphaeris hirsuta]|uniref:Acyl transferase/acyl hydrolase/lysophospholipase n=1 Tax=Lasiosphaeris hirsuta TaxID=260670 RepID=A0AA40A157_9PEZI|nr:acyl transferase/acyl hydrolase/lysophospholipase [Lasiosphaeris hirsuta]
MGVNVASLEALPVLPEDTSDTPTGTYVVKSDFEEHSIESEDNQFHYETWFQTPPLDAETIKKIHSVQLFAESHDQGWVSDANGGTWTWFELAIMENPLATVPKSKDGVTLAWSSHRNFLAEAEYDWIAGAKFGPNHDMFRLLEDGNVIAVRLAVRFAAWEIHARSGYLKIELGETIEREPLSYGNVVSSINAVQNIFQEVNSSMQTMEIAQVSQDFFTAGRMGSSEKAPLRVLSLDGGGVRGIAALMLLDTVMKKAHPGKKPYEVFDIIGGTSTGGFIAVMLGRMKMDITECIKYYNKFMKVVFPEQGYWEKKGQAIKAAWSGEKWDAAPLEKVIKDLILEKIGDPDKTLLLDPKKQDSSSGCRVFLMAVNKDGANNHAPVTLRSYELKDPLEKPDLANIKLWEACRATSAAPTYFLPLTVGSYTFLDGGLQANNPLGWLWNETLAVFGPTRPVNCFLSIGTGTAKSETLPDATASNVIGLAKGMASIATNTEMVNILFRSLINAFSPKPTEKKYWRFNIGDGCPDYVLQDDGTYKWVYLEKREEMSLGELDDVAAMDNTIKATQAYIKLEGASLMIKECAVSLAAVA